MIPRPPTHPFRAPEPPRSSVFCMGINDFTHLDSLGGPCSCACHLPEVVA